MFDLIRSLTKWKGSEQRTKEFKRISEQLGMTFSARVKGRAKDQATPPLPYIPRRSFSRRHQYAAW